LTFVGIGIICIIGAITYTVGKKAYGYHALGDLGVLVFFGGIGVIGTSYLQFPFIDKIAVFTAIAYGMWATAVLNLNNMRDVENDVVYGKKTLAYLLGFKGAKIYQAVLVITPYLFQYFVAYEYLHSARAFVSLAFLPLSSILVGKIVQVKERRDFDNFLKFQALLTLANSIVLFSCIYLLND
ncbi:MAG TPA: 1,4-dihydroxy-2-naphthoate octaprenyltransferase, partial [Flavobacteriales bacterium]|nr:1,4-dihydroxy-2-naphthoate octaprenyltransferase [Flavobacteriales bacterium]